MADNKSTAYGFFGSGEVEKENVAPLLNDELPEDPEDGVPGIAALYRPEEVPRQSTGLGNVVTWLEGEFGKRFVGGTDDIIGALLNERENGHNVVLVAVWPADPSEEEIAMAKRAVEEGIRVKNISAAMNDLDMTPYEEQPEEPEVAVEEVVEKPKLKALLSEKPPWSDDADAWDNLLVAIRAVMTEVAIEVYDSRQPGTAEAAPDEPPFDGGVTASDMTVKYYRSPDGSHRKATGRPRTAKGREETPVDLTEAQVAELQAKNLIAAK